MKGNNIDKKTTSKKSSPLPLKKGIGNKFSPSKVPPSESTPTRMNMLPKLFTYADFKPIAEKGPFTIVEWGQILHMSERTIHRYAIENAEFNGLHIERVLHVEKLINKGNNLFGKGFKTWLRNTPAALHNMQPKDLITSYDGIQELIDLLGRIEQGIPA